MNNQNPDQLSLGTVVRELTASFRDMVRSEIHLAKAEFNTSTGSIGRLFMEAVFFGGLALIGLLPFLAFCVVGLGRILNDNYWLSSLIVAVVCFAVGGGLAYSAFKRLSRSNPTLPRTRDTLEYETDEVGRKIHELSDATKRRSA